MSLIIAGRPPQTPIVFDLSADDLFQIANETIELSVKIINQITSTPAPGVSYDTIILPFIQDDNIRTDTQALTDHFQYLSPSLALRDASIQTALLWSAHGREVSTNSALYHLLVTAKNMQKSLDPEEEYFLDQKLANMARNGAGLSSILSQNQFKATSLRIEELSNICENSLRRGTGGIWFTKEELKGIPASDLAKLKVGEPGSKNDGKFWLNFKKKSYGVTRKRLFIGSENQCVETADAFKELISSRAELSKLLGYGSFADYKSQTKMMTLEAVNTFLAEMKESLTPHFEDEMQRMVECKKSYLAASGKEQGKGRIYLWDTDFYTRLLQESQQDLDEEGFSEFFSVDETVKGLLGVAGELFGLSFTRLIAEDMEKLFPSLGKTVWHDDVQVFSVWNEEALGGEFLGYLYLDLLEREGKQEQPCNITFQAGFDKADGTRQYPSTILLASYPHPSSNKPTFLRHRQILTLFHELGHAIHYCVGKTRYAMTYGTSTSPDFVEVPSKMLENWCWDASILQRIFKHYTTLSPKYLSAWNLEHPNTQPPEEKASLDLLTEFVKGRENNLAFLSLKQIWLAEFDIAIHSASTSAAVQTMNLSEMYNRLRFETTGLHGPDIAGEGKHEWGCGQARFGHMLGWYAAGYYNYSLASAYSADLFETGFKRDLMDPVQGRRYREVVIGRGGSRCAMGYLEEFLGRKPGSEAFAAMFKT